MYGKDAELLLKRLFFLRYHLFTFHSYNSYVMFNTILTVYKIHQHLFSTLLTCFIIFCPKKCSVLQIIICPFVVFLLSIILSILRLTAPDYHFGIFTLLIQRRKKTFLIFVYIFLYFSINHYNTQICTIYIFLDDN